MNRYESQTIREKLGHQDSLHHRKDPVTTESASTSTLLLDTSDRVSGSPFQAFFDLGSNLLRVRYVQLDKVILPKLNNVNAGNNTFRIKHVLGTTGVITLTPGMYNTTSIANELTAKINTAYVLAGIVDTVTVAFDTITRTFSIQSVNVLDFFIIDEDTSLFVRFGGTLIPFANEPEANIPSSDTIYSGIAAMLPTRYLMISSAALTQQQYGRSMVSSRSKPTSLLGIVDIADVYKAIDFDVSIPYKGIYQTLKVESDKIPQFISGNELIRTIDINVYDGFGRNIGEFYTLQSPLPVTSTLSAVMIFKIYF